jgi:outer membrane protein
LVNQTNLSTELQNNVNAYEYSLLSLKFQMGVPLDSAIVIALNMETVTVAENNSGFASNIDLQIIDQQQVLNDLNIKQTWAGYYPKITASASYMTQAFQNDNIAFKNWYGNSVVGGTVSWPLFDGLTKKFRVDQIRIQQTQLDLDKKYLSENLKLNITNANNKLKLSQMDLQAQDQNRKLAEEIYAAAEVQYKEGISTISDLLAVEYSMKDAQAKYLQALVKVKQVELELLNNNGNILSIAK